jgi:hypothetical protein
MCGNCHKPAEAAAPAATTEAPGTTPEATPAAGGAGTGAALAPAIPHDLAGREACLTCHDPSGGLRPAPADHAGRTNDTCQGCHQPQ